MYSAHYPAIGNRFFLTSHHYFCIILLQVLQLHFSEVLLAQQQYAAREANWKALHKPEWRVFI
ncbi:MAG: hypothetical protein A2Z71_05940 [Chloroflexi bacterium RBG_13_50_21]|nr:MAG: hypothetical protein A2Z71_05940 [Chloroflexi bacterium RBG_13_50_21]OGO59856.1 MAG: hypothetical protein A2029_00535 [Chloroflexi bacterium RBG_19FT_COMBO_47_9]